jgi:hypothetical protein
LVANQADNGAFLPADANFDPGFAFGNYSAEWKSSQHYYTPHSQFDYDRYLLMSGDRSVWCILMAYSIVAVNGDGVLLNAPVVLSQGMLVFCWIYFVL